MQPALLAAAFIIVLLASQAALPAFHAQRLVPVFAAPLQSLYQYLTSIGTAAAPIQEAITTAYIIPPATGNSLVGSTGSGAYAYLLGGIAPKQKASNSSGVQQPFPATSRVAAALLAQFDSNTSMNEGRFNSAIAAGRSAGRNLSVTYLNLPYGEVNQSGRPVTPGHKLYYLLNSSSGTAYVVNITRAVPDLKIKIGRTVVNSSTSTINLIGSSFVRSGASLVPLDYYNLSPLLSTSVLKGNRLNYTYSVYVGGKLYENRSVYANSISAAVNLTDIPVSNLTEVVFEAKGNANYTTVDPTVYYTSANSNLVISSSETLTSDLIVGSLTIDSGATLTTDGYNIYANSAVTNDGTIDMGNPGNGGAAGSPGTSESSSYAGSGGGGGGYNNAGTSGSTPSAPPMSNGNIDTWYANGFSNYLTGAGGGGSAAVAGGSGSYGIYIQANKIIAGVINAAGVAGNSDTSGTKSAGQNGGSTLVGGGAGGAASGHGGATSAGGGGGGGGVIMLAYGTGGYTTGTYTYSGGAGGSATESGGSGGNGQVATFSYSTNAPIVVLPPPPSVTLTNTNSLADAGQYVAFNAVVTGGSSPYTYNYLIFNTVTGSIIASELFTGVSSTTNTFLWNTAGFAGNTVQANVVVTSGSSTFSSTNTPSVQVINTIPVGSGPQGVAINPSGTLAYVTNYGSDTVNVINVATNTVINTITVGTNPYGVAFNPQGTIAYVVNDGSDTVSVLSTYPYITINPALGETSLVSSNPVADQGQSETITYTINGGTPPYTYNFIVSNSVNGNIIADALYANVSSTSNSFAFTLPETPNDIGTVSITANAIDSASTPESILATNTITVTTLTAPILTPSNSPIVIGQSTTFTATWTGGIAPYSAALYSSPTSACNSQSTLIQQITGITGTSAVFSPVSPTSNTFYCASVVDSTIAPSISGSIDAGFSGPFGIAFSPSGTYAYVSSVGSSNVAIVNTATSSVTSAITSGFDNPQGAAISPSGTFGYIPSSASANVAIVNTATNAVVAAITSGFGAAGPRGVAFSPDGSYAYVADHTNNNVLIINTATNAVVNSIISGIDNPQDAAFSPSSTYAYITNRNANNVLIINTATNSVEGSITSGFNYPEGVAFSVSGGYAYVVNQGTPNVVIINTATNAVIGSLPNEAMDYSDGVAFAPSGTYAYVSNYNSGNVLIVDTGTLSANSISTEIVIVSQKTVTLTNTNSLADAGQYIAFTANVNGGSSPYTYNYLIFNTVTGSIIANELFTGVSSSTNTFLWNTAGFAGNTVQANVIVTSGSSTFSSANTPSVQVINTITVGTNPYGVAFNPQGTIAYVTNSGSGSVSVINVATNAIINTISVPTPYDIAVNPQGTLAYVTEYTGDSVGVINLATNSVINTISAGPSYTEGIAFNPSGTLAYVAMATGNTVNVINVATNTVVNAIYTGASSNPTAVAVSSNGSRVYSLNYGTSSLSTIDAVTNTVLNTMIVGTEEDDIALNPSGTLAYVTVFRSDSVSVVDLATNTVVNTISLGTGSPAGVAINPQGTLAYVTDSNYGTVNVINVATNTVVNTIPVGSGPQGVAINPQGTLAYVANYNSGTVSVLSTYPYITINPALGETSLVSSNSVADQGQPETITYTINGGTPPYTYNFIVSNSVNGNIIADALYTNVSSTSNSFAFTLPETPNDIGTVSITANAIDSASTPESILATNTIMVNSPPSITIAPSTKTIDVGQSVTFTNTTTGGTSPYTYSYTVNAASGFTESGNTFTFTTAGTYNVLEKVTDTTGNVAYSENAVITVSSTFIAGNITPAAPTIDNGQSITLAANPVGGTPPYTYNWFAGTSSSCSGDVQISGATSNTYAVSPAGSTYYCYQVTDSGSVPQSLYSDTDFVTVNNALAPSLSSAPSLPASIDAGQSVTFVAAANGGTPPYSYDYLLTNTITGQVVVNVLYTGVGIGTNSFVYTAPPSDAGNTIQANVIITDSAFAPETANSATIQTLTVNAALGTPTISPSTPQSDAPGQNIIFSTTVTGGTGPYTYNWIVVNTVTGQLMATALYTGVAASSNSFGWLIPQNAIGNTVYANVIVTDSAYTPQTESSAESGVITITNTMVAGYITPISPAIDTGESVTLAANPSGGQQPYSYIWYAGTSATCSSDTTISGASSNTYVASPTSNTYYCYQVTDSGSQAQSLDSPTDLVTVNPALQAGPVTPNSPSVASGSHILLSANAINGTPPYTYQWFAGNSPSCGSDTAVSGAVASTYNAAPTSNTYYCYQVTDNALVPENALSQTDLVAVTPAAAATLTSSPALPASLDAGESITFTATAVAANSPYTYNYIIVTEANGIPVASQLFTGVGSTTNSFTWVIPASQAGNTLQANVVIEDSSVPPDVEVSPNLTGLTVYPALAAPTISPSAHTVYPAGQTLGFSTTVSGGTPPYTYKWTVVNTVDGSVIATATYSGVSAASNTFGWAIPLSDVGVTAQANVVVTDSAAIPETNNSVESGVITVASVSLPAVNISTANPTAYGSNVLVTAVCTTSDTCQLFFNGNEVASGTTTASYSICGSVPTLSSCLAPGNYVFTANDATSGNTSPPTILAIDRGTPVISFPNFPQNRTYNTQPSTITVDLGAVANQLSANIYVLGRYEANLTNSTQFNLFGPGYYVIEVNAIGNGNYLPTTSTRLFLISQPSSHGPPPPSPVQVNKTNNTGLIPQLNLTSMPLDMLVSAGASLTATMGLQNSGNTPIALSLSVPGEYSSMVHLSSSTTVLEPGQEVGIILNVKAPAGAPEGMYYVPIGINALAAGISSSEQRFLTISVVNSATRPAISSQVSLTNLTDAIGTIQVENPAQTPIGTAYVNTYLPEGVVTNTSDIVLSGISGETTTQSGYYVIHWLATKIPPGQSLSGSYRLRGVTSISLLSQIVDAVATGSQQQNSSVLAVANPSIGTIPANGHGTINITASYTGAKAQTVTFALSAPPSIVVSNPVQNVTALPGQLFNQQFYITAPNTTGTYTLIAYVYTNGANYTYYLPLIVSQPAAISTNTSTTGSNINLYAIFSRYKQYLWIPATAAAAAIILYLLAMRRRRIAYALQRSQPLIKLKHTFSNDNGDSDQQAGQQPP